MGQERRLVMEGAMVVTVLNVIASMIVFSKLGILPVNMLFVTLLPFMGTAIYSLIAYKKEGAE